MSRTAESVTERDALDAAIAQAIAAGKDDKVATVACMRTLLVSLNAMTRDQRAGHAAAAAPSSAGGVP